MAEISGSITGLNWLNPSETPLDALHKGAATGSLIAQAMAQRQHLSMEAAKLPFQLQAMDTANKQGEANLQESWMRNDMLKSDQEAWIQDMANPANQNFLNEANPEATLTGDQGVFKSLKGQTLQAGKLRAASESQLALAYQKRATEDNQISAKLIEAGGNSVWTKDQFGRPMLDRDAAATEFDRLGTQTQAEKLALAAVRPTIQGEIAQAIAGTKQETALTVAGIKQDTALAVATMKNSVDVQKLLNSPAGSQLTPAVRGSLKAMQNEFDVLKLRAASMDMNKPDNQRTIAAETARIQRKYSSILTESAPAVAPDQGKPSGSPAAGQQGFVPGQTYPSKYGPRKYLGGPITSPGSWVIP